MNKLVVIVAVLAVAAVDLAVANPGPLRPNEGAAGAAVVRT